MRARWTASFIDPPYNTGNESWCYNDNVRSPLMREWLKKATPVDKEDLERHDKWLCMMWPRLQLLHELLNEDGAIFVSIDDNEVHRLRAMMDEIFGEDNSLLYHLAEEYTPRKTRLSISLRITTTSSLTRKRRWLWRPYLLQQNRKTGRAYKNRTTIRVAAGRPATIGAELL